MRPTPIAELLRARMTPMHSTLIAELLQPMLDQKRAAIDGLRQCCERRALRSPTWWAWTVWLAHAITVRKIENA